MKTKKKKSEKQPTQYLLSSHQLFMFGKYFIDRYDEEGFCQFFTLRVEKNLAGKPSLTRRVMKEFIEKKGKDAH